MSAPPLSSKLAPKALGRLVPQAPMQRKLMRLIFLTSGMVALLCCGTLLIYDIVTFRQRTIGELETLGEILATNSTAALAFENPEDGRAVLETLVNQPNIVAAALLRADGSPFATYPAAQADVALPAIPAADGTSFDAPHLFSFQTVELHGRKLGTLFLQANMVPIFGRIAAYGGLVVLVLIGSLVVAYLPSRHLQRQISAPLIELAATARDVSEHRDFSVRVTKHADDEIGLLTDAFNHMLAEIHQLNATLERRVAQRTSELRAANEELEAFSYSVSHDLRAPLRHIDGFAQMLHKRVKGQVDDTAQRYLNTISNSAKRLGQLIDDLLVFSRMGRTDLKRTAVDMNELVKSVRQDLQPETEGRGIEWQIAALPIVEADAGMLRQVWTNLLGNGIKYTGKRERAVIAVEHRIVDDEWHVFTVRDNGAGFDMQYAQKLFGVFQRLHAESEFEGTGIGLANVKRIVQRHRGQVWAEGTPDEGAAFSFSLPRGPTPASAQPTHSLSS